MGIRYKDIFAKAKVFTFGPKTIGFYINTYEHSDGLNAFIMTLGATFVGY